MAKQQEGLNGIYKMKMAYILGLLGAVDNGVSVKAAPWPGF